MGRTVLAERDGVVRPDVDRRDVHQRRDAHRRAHVVAEDEERAAEGPSRAVQDDAVDDRAHRVLADAEVQHPAVRVAGPLVSGPLGGDERLRALDGRQVRLGEVGGTAPQLGKLGGEGVDDGAGCGAGRDLLARLERRQRGGDALGQLRACRRSTAPCGPGSPPPTRRRAPARPRAPPRRARPGCGCAPGRRRAPRTSRPDPSRAPLGGGESSPPSAEPWILPVFCLPGEGQPMIVFRTMIDGLDVSALAASSAAYSSAASSTYSPVLFQSTVCTCQPYAS